MREVVDGMSMIRRRCCREEEEEEEENEEGETMGRFLFVGQRGSTGVESNCRSEDRKKASHFPVLANCLSAVRLLPPFFGFFKKAGGG